MSHLTLTEALNTLENGHWHDVAYVSADVAKKTGGSIVRIKECMILPNENNHVTKNAGIVPKKSQAHSLNATRNLRLRNGRIRKMHIYLLFSLDNNPIL